MATEIATTKESGALFAQWGDREDIHQTAKRIQVMLPGQKLSYENALSVAQYAKLTGLNPFRGEFYAYESKGKLVLVDGYKALTRWAREQCSYTDRYDPLPKEELRDGAVIGYRCWILREDAVPMLQSLVQCGATFQEAFENVAKAAVGVVTGRDMTSRSGERIDPPTGWTWDQVARKRALKNALNISHGAPNLYELAQQSWQVNGVETIPADWEEITPEMTSEERERLAELTARERERQEAQGPITAENAGEILERNRRLLHGDNGDESDGDVAAPSEEAQAPTSEAEPEPESQPGPEPQPKSDAKTPEFPAEWTAYSDLARRELKYEKRGDVATTLKGHGIWPVSDVHGLISFDPADGWAILEANKP